MPVDSLALLRQQLAAAQPQPTLRLTRDAAARLFRRATLDGLAAGSSYYGSLVKEFAPLPLKNPVIVHLGRLDGHIPADATEAAVKAAHPDVPVYIYENAGHGFNHPAPDRYNEEAADLARHRTIELFENS